MNKILDKIMDYVPIVPCQRATQLASEAMERRLSLKETIDLKLHLAVCELCLQFSKQVRGLRQILRSYQPCRERSLSLAAKNKIKQALQHHNP